MTAVDPSRDIEAPLLPMWARDSATFHAATRQAGKRARHRLCRLLLNLPSMLFWLVGVYPWRGLARITGKVSRYLYDYDSAVVRHEHAGRTETPEYVRATNVRKSNLKARWLVASAVALPVAVPVLAWTYPEQLSALAGAILAVWIVKLIPGRGLGEVVFAAVVGFAVYHYGPVWLATIPRPKDWAVALVLGAAWLALGFLGRPEGAPLVKTAELGTGIVVPLRAAMVREKLCELGIAGMRDPDQIGLLQDAHRYGPGVQIDLDLPVEAAQVVKKREALAARLKRELGCVWPAVGSRHAAHLALYVCDEPMARQKQRPWPLGRA